MRASDAAFLMNATWTIKIRRMEILLRVGIYPHEQEPQAVWVSLSATGASPAEPSALAQCVDYEPLCTWMQTEWSQSQHTPLLETRLNELISFAFVMDDRIQQVCAGLYKQPAGINAVAVGVERLVNRLEFEGQRMACAQSGDLGKV